MEHDRRDLLVADLISLGRGAGTPAPGPDLAGAVLTRLPAAAPAPRPRRRWRVLTVGAVAVLLGLLAAPPVRAAVADWFGFGGVSVRHDPTPRSEAPPPPTAVATMSLERAARLVAFQVTVPRELGPPGGVEVSADRRVLSTTWSGGPDGTVRLDQFDGRLDYTFAKSAEGVQFTEVAGDVALWFQDPHEVVVLEPDGSRRTETARLAGHTLIWTQGATTLRLEGDLTLARAQAIARSGGPVG